MRLPELIQGIILTFDSAAYLSAKMLVMTAVWVAITIIGGWLLFLRTPMLSAVGHRSSGV